MAKTERPGLSAKTQRHVKREPSPRCTPFSVFSEERGTKHFGDSSLCCAVKLEAFGLEAALFYQARVSRVSLISSGESQAGSKRNSGLSCAADVYFIRLMRAKIGARVLATVDIILMKMSSATPTTSLRVSPMVSPVTEALCAGLPLP